MRYVLAVLLGVLCSVSPAAAQISIGIGLPGVSIGINLPVYPELVVVPNYPVYYAPRGDVNLFFYDGMYWAYQSDNWYTSTWYNGPWGLVGPEYVPAFVLRVPVRYYRHAPVAWSGWRSEAPPHWGERWGHEWEQRRSGWDRWDRRTVQAPAPLPVYQRQYSGNRYPRAEQQQVLVREQYRYQPKDPVVRQHFQQQVTQPQPDDRRVQPANQRPSPPPPPGRSESNQRSAPVPDSTLAPVAPAQGGPATQRQKLQPRPADVQREKPQPPPAAVEREKPQSPAPAVPREKPPLQPAAVQPEKPQPPTAPAQPKPPIPPAPVQQKAPPPPAAAQRERTQPAQEQEKGQKQERNQNQERNQSPEKGQNQERGQGQDRNQNQEKNPGRS